MNILVYACMCLLACSLNAAESVTAESFRREVLQALFPKAKISVLPDRTIDRSWSPPGHGTEFRFPDALASEMVYRAVGPIADKVERCAASDDVEGTVISDIRELRFQVFAWPQAKDARSDVLVVLQYEFVGANPPASCPSIGRIAHIVKRNGRWQRLADFVFDTTHHSMFERIQLLDLEGAQVQELVIESDSGGAGVAESNLVVFSLERGDFYQLLNVPSRVYGTSQGTQEEQQFVQVLDIPKTANEQAKRFCFVKTTFAAGDEWLAEPRRTAPCYPKFTGSSAREVLITPVTRSK